MAMSEWKMVILSRYLGEFQPADEDENAILKSSDDIGFDLEGMGEFSSEEISIELVHRGYKLTIDEDGKPKWLMKKEHGGQKLIK